MLTQGIQNMKLSFIFLLTITAFHSSNTPKTLKEELEAVNTRRDFITFLNDYSTLMSGLSAETVYASALKFGRSKEEAYGAQVAYPFFTSNYAELIDLTKQTVFLDVSRLLSNYSTEVKAKNPANTPFKEKERQFNEIVAHRYTCEQLGFDPRTTKTSDLAQALKDGKVNLEAYQHAMICTQFARFYLNRAAAKNAVVK